MAAKFLEGKLKALNDDLVLFFLSGGGSSLLPYPFQQNQSLRIKFR